MNLGLDRRGQKQNVQLAQTLFTQQRLSPHLQALSRWLSTYTIWRFVNFLIVFQNVRVDYSIGHGKEYWKELTLYFLRRKQRQMTLGLEVSTLTGCI
jgi:hypothetical protein|tara:strand:+ start:59 stop:349 length:291 start_codon:yes stop_codon:yes gene_type:complete